MESKNYKIKRNFISNEEVKLITEWVNTIDFKSRESNYYITELSKELNGKSHMFDISDTPLTNYITTFQSASEIHKEELPDFLKSIIERVANEMGLATDNSFVQVVDMDKGGKINAHYDVSKEGYINYKCNISVVAEDYNFYIDKDVFEVKATDMYCFEASLYKHWTDAFSSRRIFLSIGFLTPYDILGRSDNDPNVRLSKRIEKYFMKKGEK